MPDVTGAPGDGDLALTRQMRDQLAALGPVVQDSATGADFIVQGDVTMVPIAGDQQRVEIQWSVNDAAGDEARQGRAAQRDPAPARWTITGPTSPWWWPPRPPAA